MVPSARFTELLQDIEPSATSKSNSSITHINVRYHLQNHESFGDLWKSDFLAGSYARDTAIRPQSVDGEVDRADIDIIVVTGYSKSDKPDDVLYDLSDVLSAKYTVERVNKRSVRISTSKADVDVVPVIEDGDAYLIPDRDLGDWKKTNPPGHKTWSSDQNSDFGGRFKPLVKLVKWWRRENPSGKRPKGFVLEVLVARHAPKSELHYGEAFAQTLENICVTYKDDAERDEKPFIEDPSVKGNDILAKVTVAQWKAFIDKCRIYGEYARKAQDTEDMEYATTLWRRVFGARFKATATAAKAASLVSAAAAPMAATGYSFPNELAAPTKPRGFA